MLIISFVCINDDESGFHHDYEVGFEKLAPEKPYSHYRQTSCENNADALLKRAIMGREVAAGIDAGKLDFGPREPIFSGEFNRKRKKRVLVKIIGEQQRQEQLALLWRSLLRRSCD